MKAAFDYGHSVNYARRALASNGIACKPQRKCPTQDNGPEYDIAQDAFILWHRGEHYDTRSATRYAARAYLRRVGVLEWYIRIEFDGVTTQYGPYSRKSSAKRAAEEKDILCPYTIVKMQRTHKRVKGSAARAIADTLDNIPDRSHDATADTLPDEDGSKTRRAIRTIMRYLASGSTMADAASALGTTPEYVSKLVRTIREAYPVDPPHTDTIPSRPATPVRRPADSTTRIATIGIALPTHLDNDDNPRVGHIALVDLPASAPIAHPAPAPDLSTTPPSTFERDVFGILHWTTIYDSDRYEMVVFKYA